MFNSFKLYPKHSSMGTKNFAWGSLHPLRPTWLRAWILVFGGPRSDK